MFSKITHLFHRSKVSSKCPKHIRRQINTSLAASDCYHFDKSELNTLWKSFQKALHSCSSEGGEEIDTHDPDAVLSLIVQLDLLPLLQQVENRLQGTDEFAGASDDQTLNKQTLALVISSKNGCKYYTRVIKRLFDHSHNGCISFFEVVETLSILQGTSQRKKAQLLFTIIDRNGDGFISVKEAKRLILFISNAFKSVLGAQVSQSAQDQGLSLQGVEQLVSKVSHLWDVRYARQADAYAKLLFQVVAPSSSSTAASSSSSSSSSSLRISKDQFITLFADDKQRSSFVSQMSQFLVPLEKQFQQDLQNAIVESFANDNDQLTSSHTNISSTSSRSSRSSSFERKKN